MRNLNILLLVLLSACVKSKPNFKVGDCVGVYKEFPQFAANIKKIIYVGKSHYIVRGRSKNYPKYEYLIVNFDFKHKLVSRDLCE